MYITMSLTRRNQRNNEGKIEKVIVQGTGFKTAMKCYRYAKKKGHYAYYRFTTPRYNKDTHVVVDSFEKFKTFMEEY